MVKKIPSDCHCNCHQQGKQNQIVDTYYGWLKSVHTTWQNWAPCSWIVYHCVILDEDCELTEVMSRVSYVAAFYFFVKAYSFSFGGWIMLLPLIPFFLDCLRLVSLCILREGGIMKTIREQYFIRN